MGILAIVGLRICFLSILGSLYRASITASKSWAEASGVPVRSMDNFLRAFSFASGVPINSLGILFLDDFNKCKLERKRRNEGIVDISIRLKKSCQRLRA